MGVVMDGQDVQDVNMSKAVIQNDIIIIGNSACGMECG